MPFFVCFQKVMKMGFSYKDVERATLALGGVDGNDFIPSPENIVEWLLEHQAQVSQLGGGAPYQPT